MMLIDWFLWLILYSLVGWGYESAVCSIEQRKWVNRGFLNGPVCPVYGVGALVSIVFLYGRTDNLFLLFTTGMVLTCTVEYVTSVLLERLFNTRWWDYSHMRFHINGRVSLLGAVVFGVLSAVLVRFIHPMVSELTGGIPDTMKVLLSALVLVILSADVFVTVRHILVLNGRLREVQSVINSFREQQSKRVAELKSNLMERFEESEFYTERIQSLLKFGHRQNLRLSKAFPRLRHIKYEDAWEKIKAALFKK